MAPATLTRGVLAVKVVAMPRVPVRSGHCSGSALWRRILFLPDPARGALPAAMRRPRGGAECPLGSGAKPAATGEIRWGMKGARDGGILGRGGECRAGLIELDNPGPGDQYTPWNCSSEAWYFGSRRGARAHCAEAVGMWPWGDAWESKEVGHPACTHGAIPLAAPGGVQNDYTSR